jgi:acyl transferase domain-containing protein/acyl carrier protein
VSAQSPAALAELAAGYEAQLARTRPAVVDDVCAAAALSRTHHRHRLAVVGADGTELAAALMARAGRPDDRPVPDGRSVTFVFPGQGSQWFGMGRELLATEPAFRDALRRCDAAIASEAGWSVLAVLEGAESARPFDDIDVVQPTLFAMQVALAALWRTWGIEPGAVVGHSMGEIAAAHVAGALTLEDAVAVICRRSGLLRRVAGQGAMAVVDLGRDETEAALRDHRDRVSVAVSNSPRSTVISGDPAAIDELLAELEARDVFCRRVRVDVASHGPQMDPLLDDLGAAVEAIAPRPTDVTMYSTVDAAVADGRRLDAGYWARNLRQPVRFGEAVALAAADGHDVVIEISPHPILLPAVGEVLRLGGHDGAVVASMRRGGPERETMLTGLATLYERGASVEWRAVLGEPSRPVRLPTYPWQRERFWYEPAGRGRPPSAGHPLLGTSLRPAADPGTVHWQTDLADGLLAFLADHVVHGSAVMPATGFVEMLFAAAAQGAGDGPFQISGLTLRDMLAVEAQGETAVQITLERAGSDSMRARVFSVDASGTTREHAEAAIGLASGVSAVRTPTDAVRARCATHHDGAVHDTAMRRRGLAYGEAFRTVQEGWVGAGEALGRLASAAGDPVTRRIELLDGALQVALAALPAATARDTYLPVRLGRVSTAAAWPGGDEVWTHAVVTAHDEDAFHCDVTAVDADGSVLAEVVDLELRRTGTSTGALADLLYDVAWHPAERRSDRPASATTWLVYTAGGVGRDLAARLAGGGHHCVLVSPGPSRDRRSDTEVVVDPAAVDDHRAVLDDVLRRAGSGAVGIVYAWAAGIPAGDAGSTEAAEQFGAVAPLALLHALGARQDESTGAGPVRLWLVTSGAQAVEPMTADRFTVWQSVLWGLGRVVASERLSLRCTLLDLDPGRADEAHLWAEVSSGSEDQQVVLRAEERLVGRLERLRVTVATPRQSPAESFRLYAAAPGSLESLRLRVQPRRPPGAGEVEVRIDASGLNFLDVLKAMAVYPGVEPSPEVALGAECAGAVTAVGPGVHDVRVGDEVVVITPSYVGTSLLASHATVPESFVVRRPPNVPAEAAAALPIAYLTAYYALAELARVRDGERVLVHSATGGVGLAALHLCRAFGADVIATAGSEARRAQLRAMSVEHVFDSRRTAFADEVRACTGGRGVDVVLNSLPGDAVLAGLRSLAPRGRFVEIGKRDVYGNARLDLAPFRDNISFFVVDLARLTEQDPAYVSGLFQAVMAMVADGRLPALPATAGPITSAPEVFRTMAQARHTGKLVLTRPAAPVPADTPYVRPDATYLITGGLGALGLAVARRLVRRGARHLVLLGRSAPSPAAAATVEDLRREQVDLRVVAADVSDARGLASALAMVRDNMPPLRGVVHAAGTLADATIDQMDGARLRAALVPKLIGAWNVHRATLDDPLELFVLFSSAAAVLGLAGQANYAAGNAFLDALAHQRRLAGRPATSVAWGPWSDIGLAAAGANRGDRLAGRGLEGITEDEALDALEWLLAHDRTGAAVMRLDASAWLRSNPSATTMVGDLVTDAPQPADAGTGWRERLLGVPAGKRRRVAIEDALCAEMAAVLRIPADRIDRQLPLKTLGLDSLMALELRNRLEAATGLDLAATVVWNHPSVTLLAAHVAGRMAVPLEATGESLEPDVVPAPAEPGPTQAELEALLDEELAAVERLLDTESRPS